MEKAESLVNLFSKVSKNEGLNDEERKYRENIESQDLSNINDEIKDLYINSDITENELKEAINEIKHKTNSVGSDGISNSMLINLPYNALKLLLTIFQICWKTRNVPSIWKESIIVPIHKVGKNQSDPNNYRPIALTSVTCKLFEKIIMKRLTHFCDKNSIIPTNQAGFTKKNPPLNIF